MIKILTVTDIRQLIKLAGFEFFFNRVVETLAIDFGRWQDFILSPRHATYYPQGVIELMPCSNSRFHAFKYVNGHPGNTVNGKLNVIAVGQLSETDSGYPFLICDMTLLTAVRTAATGVMAAKYLARDDSSSLAIIGTGAQAEFQVAGFAAHFEIRDVYYFDIDRKAMAKFSGNLAGRAFSLVPCDNIIEAVSQADIVITATAAKQRQSLFAIDAIDSGTHIHAMGGDCPGKTEFAPDFLKQAKVVVEYRPQNLIEGEVQQDGENLIYAELWELICGGKPGRTDDQEITLFDSVGFALEDFSILRVVHELVKEYDLGFELALLPELEDPKDLFGLIAH